MSAVNPKPAQLRAIKFALFAACLVPFAQLAFRAASDRLGANPIEAITHSTGWWTLTLLLTTLAVTPLRRLLAWNWLIKLRRMLGLYAFFYGVLHFLTYVWLDQFFDLASMLKDVAKRPFITIGFATFLMLLPLAATSNAAMVRRMGAKNWLRLHRLAYAAGVAGVIHFWWLVKRDISEPALYAAVLTLLLGLRLLHLARSTRDSRR